jgi:hypothetical protein
MGVNTSFVGNILALYNITLNYGVRIVSIRALARNGAVTLDTNTITGPTPAPGPFIKPGPANGTTEQPPISS